MSIITNLSIDYNFFKKSFTKKIKKLIEKIIYRLLNKNYKNNLDR